MYTPETSPTRPPEHLTAFHAKLPDLLQGKQPQLSLLERMWVAAFRVTASRFDDLTADESFAVSFNALARCYDKQKAWCYHYVLRACLHAHRDHLRSLRQRYRRLTTDL